MANGGSTIDQPPVVHFRGRGLAAAASQFFFAATTTLLLLFLTRELHLAGTAVGLALAATGPGALAGSALRDDV